MLMSEASERTLRPPLGEAEAICKAIVATVDKLTVSGAREKAKG